MAGYRRFISYMYEYTKGRKSKNTGFAKVESRNGICRMQVHLQEIPQEEESLDIYAFVREGDWLLGIFLGRMRVQGRGADGKVSTPSEKIGDQPYDLERLAGLWVRSDFGRNYITVFDDEKVEVDKFVTELPAEGESAADSKIQTQSGAELSGEETVQTEFKTQREDQIRIEEAPQMRGEVRSGDASEMGSGVRTEEVKQAEGQIHTEEVEQTEGQVQTEEMEQTEGQVHTEEVEQTEGKVQPEEVDQTYTGPQGKADSLAGTLDETAENLENPDKPQPGTDVGAEGQQRENPGKAEETAVHTQEAAACPQPRYGCPRQVKCAQQGLDQKWQCLLKRYPRFQPFADQEIEQCIQITPRDIRLLNQNHWRLGNNSFVMHGFYNYRHLLLGRKRDGGYILGIPGLFENQERFMASMFGFPMFKDAAQQTRKGRFGYWCREVE